MIQLVVCHDLWFIVYLLFEAVEPLFAPLSFPPCFRCSVGPESRDHEDVDSSLDDEQDGSSLASGGDQPLQGSSRCYRSTGGRKVVGRSAWTYVQRSRTSRGLGSRRENGHASSHFFLSPILPRPLSSLWAPGLLFSSYSFFSLSLEIFISLGFQDLWKFGIVNFSTFLELLKGWEIYKKVRMSSFVGRLMFG